jgi:hypothetical protein
MELFVLEAVINGAPFAISIVDVAVPSPAFNIGALSSELANVNPESDVSVSVSEKNATRVLAPEPSMPPPLIPSELVATHCCPVPVDCNT